MIPAPYAWQQRCKEKTSEVSQYALLADVGTGKSRAAIMMLEEWIKKIEDRQKVLILAPSVTLTNWKNELQTYAINEIPPIYALTKASSRLNDMGRLTALNAHAVVIVNYEAFDNDAFTNITKSWGPQIVIADELHRLKSHTSKRAKAVVKIGDQALYRIGLTGTAILQSPMDIWHQWRFLDKGETFGQFLKVFRAKYCIAQPKRYGTREFVEWVFNKQKEDEFTQALSKYSVVVKKSDVMDLPPFIEEELVLEMGEEQGKAYRHMKRDFLAFIQGSDSPSVAQTAMTKGLRLMQIVSGFMTTDDGKCVRFKENPKLDALRKVLEDVVEEHKIIVWCSFKENYRMVEELCLEMGIGYAMLTGDMDANAKGDSIHYFQNVPATRVMIANRKAGGIGVNLTAASYSYVFSRNFSLEEEIQSDGRNYRGGSQVHERIVKINPVVKDSIDLHVLKAVREKKNVSDMVLDKAGSFL
jgi:SNF2 family DNA or RNA helicase